MWDGSDKEKEMKKTKTAPVQDKEAAAKKNEYEKVGIFCI